jgi:hypothetical protein
MGLISSGGITANLIASGAIVSGVIASGSIGIFHLATGVIPSSTSTTFGQTTFDFRDGRSGDVVITIVSDIGVTSSSHIVASPSYQVTSGRDLDELELESFECKGGNITSGVSFDLITLNTGFGAGAEGFYLVNYLRD